MSSKKLRRGIASVMRKSRSGIGPGTTYSESGRELQLSREINSWFRFESSIIVLLKAWIFETRFFKLNAFHVFVLEFLEIDLERRFIRKWTTLFFFFCCLEDCLWGFMVLVMMSFHAVNPNIKRKKSYSAPEKEFYIKWSQLVKEGNHNY